MIKASGHFHLQHVVVSGHFYVDRQIRTIFSCFVYNIIVFFYCRNQYMNMNSYCDVSQGHFDILSLSGSFLLAEDGDTRSRTGGLSVALAGSDGRIVGGCVAGMLMAATPVQVPHSSICCYHFVFSWFVP
jgi:hypothetical protein